MPGRRQPSQPIDHAYRQHQAAQGAHLLGWEVRLVMQGVIVKLVRSYGSAWGRIEPLGGGRQVFFNKASLPEGADFADLRDGQVVQFEEEDDRANGTHAVRIVLGDLPKMGSTATPNTSILPGR